MVSAMLDTNILFDFLLIQRKEDKKQEIPKFLKKSEEIRDALLNNEFKNCLTDWNLFELRDRAQKLILEIKLLREGFNPNEFRHARKYISLDESELKSVEEFVGAIRKISIPSYTDINPHHRNHIHTICKDGGFDSKDILLTTCACLIHDCDYFVTRDAPLKNRLIELKYGHPEIKEELKIKIIGPKEFIDRLKKEENKKPPD